MPLEQVPYTNFHGANQDWIIKQIKQLINEWADYEDNLQQQYDAFTAQINADFDAFKVASEAAFQSLRAYVDNYFDNLDVQAAIDHKLDEMIASGEWDQILQDYFDNLSAQVEADLANQNQIVNRLDTQMTNFIENMGPHDATLRTCDTLWSGSEYQDNDALVLNGLVSDYDFIEVYVNMSNRTAVQRFDVARLTDNTGASALTINLANKVTTSPAGLAVGELNIKAVAYEEGDTYTTLQTSFNYWHWNGDAVDDSTQQAGNNTHFRLIRIDGVKYTDTHAEKDPELLDLRTDFVGRTYPTAGDAIRAVEQSFEDTFVSHATQIGSLEGVQQIIYADVEGTPNGLIYKVPNPPTYDPQTPPLYCLTVQLTGNDHDVPSYSWMDWGTWKNWL